MANASISAYGSDTGSANDPNKERIDPWTLQGYMKMFDDEKDGSTLRRQLICLYDKEGYEMWKKLLINHLRNRFQILANKDDNNNYQANH
ncbi:unnamed protein product [Rotaria sordida]|uniref:Uncharacterized protein n=1 Tax=Rotaria sordida TaxID=392033 RepID=A0A815I529_9BILA|nr:unnamed protein product [Rotaria sordida]